MRTQHSLLVFVVILSFGCKPNLKTDAVSETTNWPIYQRMSILGDSLWSFKPTEKVLADLETAEKDYAANPQIAENIIWYGRRMAYTGQYGKAISIYEKGISQHPSDARFYRHRGHRYISIRQYNKALIDFKKAVENIQDQPNTIEPDGIPNARNTPVSTLHGNIYYHQGLAYYLINDLDNALTAFQKCRNTANNPDNIVSSSHWLYMILRLLDRPQEAKQVLADIDDKMDIIENWSYYKLCRLYKGAMTLEEVVGAPDQAASGQDAIDYGIANWHHYNGRQSEAKSLLEAILKRPSWNSFGYIAAEADYQRRF